MNKTWCGWYFHPKNWEDEPILTHIFQRVETTNKICFFHMNCFFHYCFLYPRRRILFHHQTSPSTTKSIGCHGFFQKPLTEGRQSRASRRGSRIRLLGKNWGCWMEWFWSNYSDLTRLHRDLTRLHRDLTPKGSFRREIPLFHGNLGWWNISNLTRWLMLINLDGWTHSLKPTAGSHLKIGRNPKKQTVSRQAFFSGSTSYREWKGSISAG